MVVDWTGYTLYPVLIPKLTSELERADARTEFKHAMTIKEERKSELANLTSQNGIELEHSYNCILDLNAWFRENISTEPGHDGHLLAEWYSFCKDLNLYLGDWLIEKYPWLRWALYTTSKKSLDYQSPAIIGYKEKSPNHVNFDISFAGWGIAYVEDSHPSKTAFLRQFIHNEDIPQEQCKNILIDVLGPNSKWI